MNPDLTIKEGTIWYDTDSGVFKTYDGANWNSARYPETYESKINRLAEKYPAVAEARAHLDALIAMVEHE